MKRLISLLLSAALLVTAAGCGTAASSAEASAEVPVESPATVEARALTEAAYPSMVAYPDESEYVLDGGLFDSDGWDSAFDTWWADQTARRDQPEGFDTGLQSFWEKSMAAFLTAEDGENRVYSPVNVYMALAMLTELTAGDSQSQLLSLLEADSAETLRQQAKSVWTASYQNDGASTSILASSLWISDSVQFNQDTLDTLAENYYAASYAGEMGSNALNNLLRDWINDQTGGLLKEQAETLSLSADTILALVTTVYYRARWNSVFSSKKNTQEVFHGTAGDTTATFMHHSGSDYYYWGDQFSAVRLGLDDNSGMWLILPDEGTDAADLLSDSQVIALLEQPGETQNSKYLTVNLSMPKFDAVSDVDFSEILQTLGVTDVFDAEKADFSPMTTDAEQIFVSQARHAARVAVDEEGVTAAAYTVMEAAGAAMPPEDEVDFTLDRPFLFVIMNDSNLPLFCGVVNQTAS